METLINTLNLPALRNGEFVQLFNDFIGIVSRNDPSALKIEKLYTILKSETDNLNAMFKVDRGSVLTDELLRLDEVRDEAIIGLGLVADGYTHHYDEATRKYASSLVNHLGNYGSGIARQSLPMETATLTNIVSDWTEKPALAAAIKALNLDAWKNQLSAANKAFNDKYL